MLDSDVFIVDRFGRRRVAKKGGVMADGDRLVFPVTLMDAQLRDVLAEKYRGGGAVRVVDAAGLPAGHRPGFLFDSNNALADSAAEVAYRERVQQLDVKSRKRRQPDDDEEDDDDPRRRQESESERRQRLACKAARATMGTDARQLTLDQARAAADAAREARDERMRNAWRNRRA